MYNRYRVLERFSRILNRLHFSDIKLLISYEFPDYLKYFDEKLEDISINRIIEIFLINIERNGELNKLLEIIVLHFPIQRDEAFELYNLLNYREPIFNNKIRHRESDEVIEKRIRLSKYKEYNPNEKSLTTIENKSNDEDFVNFSLYTTTDFRPSSNVLFQFWAHLSEKTKEVAEFARLIDECSELVGFKQLETKIKHNTLIELLLIIPKLKIREIKFLKWSGKTIRTDFEVAIPENFNDKHLDGKCVILVDKIPVGRITFNLNNKNVIQNETVWTGIGKKYKFTYLSFAEKDEYRIKPDINFYEFYGQEYFIAKEYNNELVIKQNIDKSDVFCLYWSKNAIKSKRVEKEINYAIQKKGNKLDNPPELLPLIIEENAPEPTSELIENGFNNNKINHIMRTNKKYPIFSAIVGIIFMLISIGIIIFIPYPSSAQYTFLRIFLSIAVAAFASIIPGYFDFKYKELVVAGGALGIFAFVFLINPAQIVNTDEQNLKGIVYINNQTSQGITITNLETQIPAISNENGIFSMPIPKNKLKGTMSFKLKSSVIDTIIKINIDTINFEKNIELRIIKK